MRSLVTSLLSLAALGAASASVLLASAVPGCSSSTDADPSGTPDDAGSGGNDGAIGEGGATTDATSPSDAGKDAAPTGPVFAFVGSSAGFIRVYRVDLTSGGWTLVKESAAGQNPSFLAFHPSRPIVVAVDEIAGTGVVRSFAFDAASGTLTPISDKPSGGSNPTHLSFDPAGRFVLVANYSGGTVSVFPIDAAGVLGDASDTKSSGPKSHWAGTNPSGTHAFVPALDDDAVAQYALDGAGKLTANGSAALPNGAGPRHLAFSLDETHAYTINELDVTVTAFAFDKGTGKLTPGATISALPPGQSTAGVTGAEIVVHPSGRFVYASTRGFDSIACFSGGGTGTLVRVANSPTGAKQPRSFGLSPEGELLYAGNQTAGHVAGFRVDATTGALTSIGKTVDVSGPSFVGLSRAP